MKPQINNIYDRNRNQEVLRQLNNRYPQNLFVISDGVIKSINRPAPRPIVILHPPETIPVPRVTVTRVQPMQQTAPSVPIDRQRKYSFMESETVTTGIQDRYGFMNFPADTERRRTFGTMGGFMDRKMPGRSIADTVGYRFNFMNEGADHNKFGMQ